MLQLPNGRFGWVQAWAEAGGAGDLGRGSGSCQMDDAAWWVSA